MEPTRWLKQSADKPLFEDMLWLRPENPHQRPKVLIVGGSSHGFVMTTKLYEAIKSKSAYQTRVMLPKSLEKILGKVFDDSIFVDSTGTGEINLSAKNELASAMGWADAVIFSADLGNNSQTEILLTKLIPLIDKPAYFIDHAIDLLHKTAQIAVTNPNLIFVGDIKILSKLNAAANSQTPRLQADGLIKTVDKLQTITTQMSAALITNIESKTIVADSGQVSTTDEAVEDWKIKSVAGSIQFAKNFNTKRFEALTTSSYLLLNGAEGGT